MKKTLNLQDRLKNQMQKEQEIIQSLTEEQLSNFRQELMDTYKKELATTTLDIKVQNSRLIRLITGRYLMIPVLILTMSLAVIWFSTWGLTQLFAQDLLMMKANVAQMEKEGGKIQISNCGDKRRLCVQIDKKSGMYQDDYMIIKGY